MRAAARGVGFARPRAPWVIQRYAHVLGIFDHTCSVYVERGICPCAKITYRWISVPVRCLLLGFEACFLTPPRPPDCGFLYITCELRRSMIWDGKFGTPQFIMYSPL